MNILPTIIVRDITTLKSITSVFGLHIFFIFFYQQRILTKYNKSGAHCNATKNYRTKNEIEYWKIQRFSVNNARTRLLNLTVTMFGRHVRI